jgi:hypothetical protein
LATERLWSPVQQPVRPWYIDGKEYSEGGWIGHHVQDLQPVHKRGSIQLILSLIIFVGIITLERWAACLELVVEQWRNNNVIIHWLCCDDDTSI